MHQRTISLKKTIAIANLISLASTSFIAADAAQAEGVTEIGRAHV